MLLQTIKRLRIISWLLLTLNLTLLYSTIISTVLALTPTFVAATTDLATAVATVTTSTAAVLTPVTTTKASATTTANFSKRLHLQLQHHQYQQQQYPASYQNYPFFPQIATELMDPLETSNQPGEL